MLLKNGDEIHLLVEDKEAGIAFTEEIGMIFVVLHDMSIAPVKERGRTDDNNGVEEEEASLQKTVEEKEQSENKEAREVAA